MPPKPTSSCHAVSQHQTKAVIRLQKGRWAEGSQSTGAHVHTTVSEDSSLQGQGSTTLHKPLRHVTENKSASLGYVVS